MILKKRHCEEGVSLTKQSRSLKYILDCFATLAMTAILFVFASGVHAQTEEAPVSDTDQRLTLSAQMHEIWPVRTRVEDALDLASRSFDADNRPSFKAQMRQAINFDTLEEESIKVMADIYTARELEAMVAFYGSPEGRAVSAKSNDYANAIQPVITRMLDAALITVRTGRSAP